MAQWFRILLDLAEEQESISSTYVVDYNSCLQNLPRFSLEQDSRLYQSQEGSELEKPGDSGVNENNQTTKQQVVVV